MEQPKCPECGSTLWRGARKCKKCGIGVVICRECGSAYKKGEHTCDMCGRELKRFFKKSNKDRPHTDDSAPNDLVSVINNVRAKSVSFRIVRLIRWVALIVSAVFIAVSIPVGLLFGELPTVLTIQIADGNISMVWSLLTTTFARTVGIWREFINSLANDGMTVYVFLSFFNYFLASLLPATFIFTVYYATIHIPLELIETLICGIIAKKRGYSAFDTVTVFECPSLIYNSADSFNKAYTYFPFTEKTKGKLGALVSLLLPHVAVLLCAALAILVFFTRSVSKIVIWILLGRIADLTVRYVLLAIIVVLAILGYAAIVLLSIILTNAIRNAIHKHQLSKWSKMHFQK